MWCRATEIPLWRRLRMEVRWNQSKWFASAVAQNKTWNTQLQLSRNTRFCQTTKALQKTVWNPVGLSFITKWFRTARSQRNEIINRGAKRNEMSENIVEQRIKRRRCYVTLAVAAVRDGRMNSVLVVRPRSPIKLLIRLCTWQRYLFSTWGVK